MPHQYLRYTPTRQSSLGPPRLSNLLIPCQDRFLMVAWPARGCLVPRAAFLTPSTGVVAINPLLNRNSIILSSLLRLSNHITTPMLCDRCRKLSFRRFDDLPPAEAIKIGELKRHVYGLYCLHSETLTDLEISQVNCSLCRKIWDALERQICDRNRPRDDLDDRDSVGYPEISPVYLELILKDADVTGDAGDSFLASGAMFALCAEARVMASFDLCNQGDYL